MNLLEYSRWGGQEPPSGIENNGKVVQFIDYQTRYLILTDSAETASDLVLQLSKDISDDGEQMDFKPSDSSDRPFSVKISPFIKKIFKLENNDYEDEVKIQAVGMDLADLELLNNSGFIQNPSQEYDPADAWANSNWVKGKSFSSVELDERLAEEVSKLLDAHEQLAGASNENEEWVRQEMDESRSKIADYLQSGANIHANEEQILIAACKKGVLEVAQLCLESSADLSAQDHSCIFFAMLGDSPSADILELLAKHGADEQMILDCRLVQYCRSGDLESVASLMNEGAKCKDSSIVRIPQMALNAACGYGHLDVVKYLLENDADISCEDATYFCYAVEEGFTDVVKYLIEQGVTVDANGGVPLRVATVNQNLELVQILLQAGANPNTGDEVLHALFCTAYADVTKNPSSLSRRIEIAGMLINAGADINEIIEFEHFEERVELSPLAFACRNGESEIAQFLLDNGADVNGHVSSTALSEACKQFVGPDRGLASAEVLINAGADPNLPGTALLWACARLNKDLIKLLLANGADPNIADDDGGAVLNVVKDFISGVQRMSEAEDECEMEEALQYGFAIEDLSMITIEDGNYPTWVMSTNDFVAKPGSELVGFGLSAFRKPSEDCLLLQRAVGGELEVSTWAQYPEDFNPLSDQIFKSPDRFQKEIVQKNNNLLNVGLTLPIEAFAELLGDSFGDWVEEINGLPESKERDVPAKELAQKMTIELNEKLADAGLPQCTKVFTLPWVRVMFGSSLELGRYYVLFPEELYEEDTFKSDFHKACGEPAPAGFATISY
mgnify:CR=1 FL=1